MSISKRVRFEIFKRDKFTCQYCGRRPPDVTLELDHIVARCEGGTDAPENLTTSCLPCNRGKSGVPLDSVAPAVGEMAVLGGMQEMLERQRAIRASTTVAEASRITADEAVATIERWWETAFGQSGYVTHSAASVRKFVSALSMEQISDAIETTSRHPQMRWGGYRAFRYFCAVCWRMIRDAEAINA